MRRFFKKYSIVYHMGTKVSQCPPGNVCQEAMDFQEFVRQILPKRDWSAFISSSKSSIWTRRKYIF